ncbi:MAG: hypothetical protein LIO67_01525 [Lachnospiraceae bacterium]|nr:hypothetical protein [Lachnospiraceae bacterium]
MDEKELQKLHVKCVDEVKRINGAVDLESAYKYQRRESCGEDEKKIYQEAGVLVKEAKAVMEMLPEKER